MRKSVKILICDDHELILTGIRQVLSGHSFVDSVISVNNGIEAQEALKNNIFHVVISDVSMPEMDGISLSEYIKTEYPDIKLIMLTQFTDMQVLKQLLKNNVDGILLKGGSSNEIIDAVEKVCKGQKCYSNTIMHVLADLYAGDHQNTEILVKLSKREQQVLDLIAEEQTNKEISESLFISVPTVETYRRNLFRKFEVKNSVGLIRMAMRLGFVS